MTSNFKRQVEIDLECDALITLGAKIRAEQLGRGQLIQKMHHVFESNRLLMVIGKRAFHSRFSDEETLLLSSLSHHLPVALKAGPEGSKFSVGFAHSFDIVTDCDMNMHLTARVISTRRFTTLEGFKVVYDRAADGTIIIYRLEVDETRDPPKGSIYN